MNYYGYEFHRESDISHHGILGMKWGIRRFQNKDGTRTAAGKKREQRANYKEIRSATRSTKNPNVGNRIENEISNFVKTNKKVFEDVVDSQNAMNRHYDSFTQNEKMVKKNLELAFTEFQNGTLDKHSDSYEHFADLGVKNDEDFIKRFSDLARDQDFINSAYDHYISPQGTGHKDWMALRTNYEKSVKKEMAVVESLTNKLVGEYGNRKITYENPKYRYNLYDTPSRIIGSVVYKIASENYRKN